MGCGASQHLAVNGKGNPYVYKVNDTWNKAHNTLDIKKGKRYQTKKLIVKRSGWKTVRIFVSSTFKDFHAEREVLVKKVFPDLRVWCEQRRLQLIDCDLRWGVPSDFNVEGTLRACLGEIDRCFYDNVMPYFVNMTSERAGWIPAGDEIPEAVRGQYKWIDGLSVTEMEIMHAAYRNDNPNALFLLRKSDFLNDVPEEYKDTFVDSNPLAAYKLDMLKKMIKDRFPDERTYFYDVQYNGVDPETGTVALSGLNEGFSQSVFEFFKRRIEEQYPMPDANLDPYHHIKEQHESFMKNRSEDVIGREDFLSQIDSYFRGIGNDVPFVLVGAAGSGKSSLVAKAVDLVVQGSMQGKIPGGGKEGWHVFYHFVGAVPGSTELEAMLRRLLREMGVCDEHTMPKDLSAAATMACGALNNPKSRPTIIIVDALNQLDEEEAAQLVSWVPRKLAPHIRCLFSMIPNTPQHKELIKREPKPQFCALGPLDIREKMAIVQSMLGRYNKRLDEQQMTCLLDKESSSNPLWLSIACEELRVFGQYRQVSDKINTLPDGLLDLEMAVLTRFEKENGGELLVGALCLLEVSSRGLLEVELVTILGDEENLFYDEKPKDASEKDDSKKEKAKKEVERLPAYKWAEVYRGLKPFLRPFGDSGEGRLDFYHRSLSKAVRKKYFQDSQGNNKEEVYLWWHLELADYFETVANIHRKIEEYPTHLIALKDEERMASFLSDWEVFDSLFNEDYSTKLLYLWRTGSSFKKMETCYCDMLNNMKNSEECDLNKLGELYEKVSRLLAQAGQHGMAQQLLTLGMKLETEELGERDERMARFHYLTGFVEDEIQRGCGYYEMNQKPGMRLIITSFEKACAIIEKNKSRTAQYQLGRIKNRLAFYYTSYINLGGDEYYSVEVCKEQAFRIIDEAIQIFKDLDDELNVGDCLTTKGVCYGRAVASQIKVYLEARDILIPKVGELHPYINRLYHNVGIYYEEMRDYNAAFDYFRMWYVVCRDLYGESHPNMVPAREALQEYIYANIAKRRGIPVPTDYSPQEPDEGQMTSDDDGDGEEEATRDELDQLLINDLQT